MPDEAEWIAATQAAKDKIFSRFPKAETPNRAVDHDDWVLCQDVGPEVAALIIIVGEAIGREAKVAKDNFITAFNAGAIR